MEKEIKQKAFTAHKANGIRLVFPNGNKLSTIWGRGNYCDNYDWEDPSGDIVKTYETRIKEGSDTVEVMPTCSKNVKKLLDETFPNEENGSVYGHLTFTQWLKMVNLLNENNF